MASAYGLHEQSSRLAASMRMSDVHLRHDAEVANCAATTISSIARTRRKEIARKSRPDVGKNRLVPRLKAPATVSLDP
jgi:hypothetical protein